MRNNKELGREKTSRIPIKILPREPLKKPAWIKMQLPKTTAYMRVKNLLNEQKLHSVCEEASCPNISECYSHGTATFMILGDLCTRRCPFCDVISYQNSVSPLIEIVRQSLKSLLSSSVPYFDHVCSTILTFEIFFYKVKG